MKNKLCVFVFCFCAELTTGGVDIAAEMTAHSRNDMIFCQSFGKATDIFSVRRGKSPARCVDGDKIYVQRHIRAILFQDCRKGARVLFRIVFACRKRVFKGYSPSCFRKIIVTRRQKLLNAPFPVYRHERGAGFVIGMESVIGNSSSARRYILSTRPHVEREICR